ncbi:hypothetical protein VTN49DRAFT_5940 [Thermomyces lanuginosus]|uniref:uncharacterized protein n=1 Tax=Thermomyces lanuginosus TaxID=5541 RepID=UPI003742E695
MHYPTRIGRSKNPELHLAFRKLPDSPNTKRKTSKKECEYCARRVSSHATRKKSISNGAIPIFRGPVPNRKQKRRK